MRVGLTWLKKWLIKKYVPKLMACGCPPLIPRSGKAGDAVRCFTLYLGDVEKPDVMLTGFDGAVFTGNAWGDNSYTVPTTESLDDAVDRLVIWHYYGVAEVVYQGIFDYLRGRFFRFEYLYIRLSWGKSHVAQLWFNNKKLVTTSRTVLLKALLAAAVDGQPHVSVSGLLRSIHGIRLYGRPDKKLHINRAEVFLDGMRDTKEVAREHSMYSITGHGIATLERYEEEARKHKAQVRIQWLIALLTCVIALTGVYTIFSGASTAT